MWNLKKLGYLTIRNLKLYFKDKMTFLVSLITPIILFVLFATFLKSTYEQQLINIVGENVLSSSLINAFSGGWLFSSVLATSCVTVAFCSGIMIIDKINNADIDFKVTPIKNYILKLSYVIANMLSTFIVCFAFLIIGLIYLGIVGFYLTFIDVLLIIANMFLTSLFATLLANIIWSFARSQGVMSSVCTLVSALYGFICGAYMPISTMGEGIRNFTSLLSGTYSTILFRQGFLNGALDKMQETLPAPMVEAIKESFDVTYNAFGHDVPAWGMYLILIITCFVLLTVLIIISNIKIRRKTDERKRKNVK